MDPLCKQLITASPNTLLDIQKLQKRNANLLKNRGWFPNTTPSAGAPIFYIVQSPKCGGAERFFCRFFFANCDQWLRLSTSMQHYLDKKTTIDLSKLRLEAVADIAQMCLETKALC
jgi:hypothetical protein